MSNNNNPKTTGTGKTNQYAKLKTGELYTLPVYIGVTSDQQKQIMKILEANGIEPNRDNMTIWLKSYIGQALEDLVLNYPDVLLPSTTTD
jgi:hypothetical protein